MSGGETDLGRLLRGLAPALDDVPYAFCLLPTGREEASFFADATGMFREAEGVTLILPCNAAQRLGLAYDGEWARITLTVHSSLAAVGMIAAISRALTDAGISTNPVAAFYHDHLFVQWAKRDRAIEVIRALTRSAVT
ncbi:MAG: ACT domain-containing protein [Gemmatimonadetes bacterium]|nr:ACT domain-containing protein [Gemmatimonadota bacterium]